MAPSPKRLTGLQRGEELAEDAWVLDWSDWAGVYEIWLRRREQLRELIQFSTPI
jgi:hypothetical protein